MLKKNEICLGFASYEHHYLNSNSTRLHKFYLLTEHQGKGMGKLMLDKIVALAKENRSDNLSLNVNRFNKAFVFYQKMGFEIIAETSGVECNFSKPKRQGPFRHGAKSTHAWHA